MSERKVQILKAAEIVFSRYGVSKTTMNDIAKTAGVARQTLYNEYPNKESVLRATLRFGAEKTMADVEARQFAIGDQVDAGQRRHHLLAVPVAAADEQRRPIGARQREAHLEAAVVGTDNEPRHNPTCPPC